MGLDMYLTGESFYCYDHPNRKQKPFPIKGTRYDLGYWRKHPNLHGYIVQTFAGGVDECQEIQLTKEELGKLIEAIKSRQLPHTEGFFFGESNDSEEQIAADVAILEAAIRWLEEDAPRELRSVSYRASW